MIVDTISFDVPTASSKVIQKVLRSIMQYVINKQCTHMSSEERVREGETLIEDAAKERYQRPPRDSTQPESYFDR
jgi:hypothetical protein